MLSNSLRQEAYWRVTHSNPEFAGKRVLDVGVGTGILQIFCAQAGASRIYAIESSNIAELTLEIVKERALDNITEVHQTKIEDF